MGKWPFKKKKIYHFAQFFKLIKEMLLFWNSIFGQSSYNKLKKKKILEPYSGVLRPYNGVLKLEFHAFFFFKSLIDPYL